MPKANHLIMRSPVCLIPETMLSTCESEIEDLFTVLSFTTTDDAWNKAEVEKIDLFFTDQRFIDDSMRALLTGLKVLHPEMIHLHIVRQPDANELMDLVNISSRMRVVHVNDLDQGVKAAGADVFSMIMTSERKDRKIEELMAQNEQFEFMLRQSLLFE